MRRPPFSRLLVVLTGVLLALSLATGCTSTPQLDPNAVIIDVRTPAEFQAGHLDGARNIDVQGATFASDIASLPKDGAYAVYCRSGARASAAATAMTQAGFTNVVNLGGIDAASKTTGRAIVQ